MKKSEPHTDEEFYVNNKRYIVKDLLSGKGNQEISKKMRDLAKKLVEEDDTLPIWITVERQQLKHKSFD